MKHPADIDDFEPRLAAKFLNFRNIKDSNMLSKMIFGVSARHCEITSGGNTNSVFDTIQVRSRKKKKSSFFQNTLCFLKKPLRIIEVLQDFSRVHKIKNRTIER